MLSSCIGVVMKDGALLRSSSLFIAYMGCLGWGSAYFYGWGTSFYYGFPWWIVGAGVDDVARSLFFAVIVIAIFLIGWGIGVVFFFAVKRKTFYARAKCISPLFCCGIIVCAGNY